jgi:hypothetical protein
MNIKHNNSHIVHNVKYVFGNMIIIVDFLVNVLVEEPSFIHL